MTKVTEKTIDAHRGMVRKPLRVPVEQCFVHGGNADGTAQHGEVGIAPQTFALAFTKLKILQSDAQQNDPAGMPPPFPEIAAKQEIRPIRPAVFAKSIEHSRMQRLHRDVLFDVIRIEGNILKKRERLRIQDEHRRMNRKGMSTANVRAQCESRQGRQIPCIRAALSLYFCSSF